VTLLPAERPADFTPAQADQWESEALRAIDQVSDPDVAEDLLHRIKLAEQAVALRKLGREYEQRWGRVRLLAERRYGELLGPAEHGGDRRSDQVGVSDLKRAEKDARHEARKVAAIPEPTFNEYVDNAESPSRAGLLREAEEPVNKADVALTRTGEPRKRKVFDYAPGTKRHDEVAAAHVKRINNLVWKLDGFVQGIPTLRIDMASHAATDEQLREWDDVLTRTRAALLELRNDIRKAGR
jgi:hypothetical protein